jgi:hypothetical protein
MMRRVALAVATAAAVFDVAVAVWWRRQTRRLDEAQIEIERFCGRRA